MNREELISAIIEHLQLVLELPRGFIVADLPGVYNFMAGFDEACKVMGLYEEERDITYYTDIMIERGWRISMEQDPVGGLSKMLDELDEEAFTKEWITLFIEAWKKTLENIK